MKRRPVRLAVASLLMLAVTLVAAPASFAQGNDVKAPQLTGRIDFQFAGHLNEYDAAGRKLLWIATIEGDLNGTMRWWFAVPSPAPKFVYAGGQVNYYAARWEIWDGGVLLLAGESSGKTVTPIGQDGMWDGAGVVTEGSGKYNVLKGRHIYETGPVVMTGLPYGTGIFSVF
ncbi:MAG: hypothetical protein R6V57_18115 [Vicinamibacterales bacterium]